jgi:hypothetical protein
MRRQTTFGSRVLEILGENVTNAWVVGVLACLQESWELGGHGSRREVLARGYTRLASRGGTPRFHGRAT